MKNETFFEILKHCAMIESKALVQHVDCYQNHLCYWPTHYSLCFGIVHQFKIHFSQYLKHGLSDFVSSVSENKVKKETIYVFLIWRCISSHISHYNIYADVFWISTLLKCISNTFMYFDVSNLDIFCIKKMTWYLSW